MPWQLPPELAERVQRARRLLAESEEHAGSTELQCFVDCSELTVELHSFFLGENGLRNSLNSRQQREGLALLLCWALWRLEGPNVPLPVDAACLLAISDVVLSSLESLKNGSLAAGHEDVVLMHLSTACYTLLMVQDSDEELWLDKCQLLLAALQRQAAEPRCFVALAVYQQRQGFACWLDARGLRRLNLLLQQTGLEQTAASAEEAQQASAEEAQQAIQQRLLDVSRQLCAEQPDSPAFTYHQVLALLMTNSRDAALQACRTAMRLAHSQNAHWLLLKALLLFVTMGLDTRGPKGIATEALLAGLSAADRALACCSAWVPKALIEAEEHLLSSLTVVMHHRLAEMAPNEEKRIRQTANRLVPQLLGAPAAPAGDEQPAAAVPQPPLPQPGQNDEHTQQAAPPEAAPAVRPTTQRLLPQPPHQQQQQQQVQQQQGAATERCCLCGEAAPSPARCGRCRTTVYCGRRCQMEHWLGGHREECTRIVTQRFIERVAAVARARAGRA